MIIWIYIVYTLLTWLLYYSMIIYIIIDYTHIHRLFNDYSMIIHHYYSYKIHVFVHGLFNDYSLIIPKFILFTVLYNQWKNQQKLKIIQQVETITCISCYLRIVFFRENCQKIGLVNAGALSRAKNTEDPWGKEVVSEPDDMSMFP